MAPKKKISQVELAKTIGVHAPVIGRNERNEENPLLMLPLMAEALEVSLKYLVGNSDLLLEKNVADKILDIHKLNTEDKAHIFAMLDAFLQSQKAKKVFAS